MKDYVKISFVGDIMCEMEQNRNAKKDETYSYDNCFQNLKEVFNDSDYVVGNLETPIAGEECGYTSHIWSFNTPISFIQSLKNVGFDLVCTANNHCLDRGTVGLLNTLNALDEVNLAHIGTYSSKESQRKPYIVSLGGIHIGFLSYTYGTNAKFNNQYLKKKEDYMVNLFYSQEVSRRQIFKYLKSKYHQKYAKRLKNDIETLKQAGADYIIMCMHSGGQHNLEVDKSTIKLSKDILKMDVDAIVGCHPHVVQKAIWKDQKFCAYSLGNFFGTAGTSSSPLDKLSDYSIVLNFYLKKEKSVVLDKATFSIMKMVTDSNKNTVLVPLYDYIKDQHDSKILIEDNQTIVKRFLNTNDNIPLQKEYAFNYERTI